MSFLEKYRRATERDVTAPSGIIYRVRGLSSVEYGNALSGVPGLLASGEKSATSLEDVLTMQRKVCGFGTISASFEGEMDHSASEQVGDWPASDLASVFLAIQQASGLSGVEADSARGALPE